MSAQQVSFIDARLRIIPPAVLAVLFVGYQTMSRVFAHWGFSPIYVSEVSLALMLLMTPFAFSTTLVRSLFRQTPLTTLSWCYYIFLVYGAISLVRGVLAGYPAMVSVKCFVFNVYPVFLFAAVWVGQQYPRFLERLILVSAWCVGIYGVVFVLVFSPLGLTERVEMREEVGWFGAPGGACVMVMGLLAFSPDLRKVMLPLLLNLFLLLAMQVRATWLAVALGLPIWAVYAGRVSRLIQIVSLLALLLTLGLVFDVRLPSPATRGNKEWGGHEFTTRHLVARAIAAIDEKSAAALAPEHAAFYAGTVSWRTEWWRQIWERIHENSVFTIVGPGYGFPIWDLHPEKLQEEELRTPHNVFMFCLSYTGWLGVTLFSLLMAELLRLMWLVYVKTGQPFGIILWVMILSWGAFDNFFETPFGAIPFFILAGLCVAPLMSDPASVSQSRLPSDAKASTGRTANFVT